MTLRVPDGFVETGAALPGVGPLFAPTGGGETVLGFAAAPVHCAAPDGLLSSLQAAFAAHVGEVFVRDGAAPAPPPGLVSLSCAFVARATAGQWVQGTARLVRRTRSLVFAHIEVGADGRTVMTAEGVWHAGPHARAGGAR